METDNTEKKARTMAILEIITGVGLILFWIGFFTIGLAPKDPPPCYFTFEHCFPLPDILMALALLVAGILVLKKAPLGRALSMACCGGLIFLGLLDFSFNIQNGMYVITPMDGAFNALINLWCVGFGLGIFFVFRK